MHRKYHKWTTRELRVIRKHIKDARFPSGTRTVKAIMNELNDPTLTKSAVEGAINRVQRMDNSSGR